uniref:Regulator of chromosome condensation 2 n=1 Tax=Bos mutus grunniens TaxID=30521 RepID=A0A8B9WGV4_BOSMU
SDAAAAAVFHESHHRPRNELAFLPERLQLRELGQKLATPCPLGRRSGAVKGALCLEQHVGRAQGRKQGGEGGSVRAGAEGPSWKGPVGREGLPAQAAGWTGGRRGSASPGLREEGACLWSAAASRARQGQRREPCPDGRPGAPEGVLEGGGGGDPRAALPSVELWGCLTRGPLLPAAAYRNLGQNLWGPHRYGCLSGVRVRTVVSGSCAAHSLLITTEGKLWSWGRNEKGQLGHGDTKRVEAPRLVEGLSHEVIVSAACGRNHTLALTETGSVFAFGENKMGQLGLGNQTDAVPSPAQIMYNGQPITKMACGAEFSMIMDCKGNLYSFGCPEYGQLGHNSDGKFIARAQRIEYDCELVPRRVAIFIEKTKDGQILPVPNVVVRDVACGANHTLVLDSQKRVFSWGFGGYGRLGHAEQKDEMVPRLVKLFDFPGRGASQIYAGYTCSFAVSEVGGLFFWGATNTSRESTMYPKAVQDLCGWRIRSLACGKSSIIVAADESTISWGPSPTFGELVAMGYSHSLVIARDESEAEKEKIRKLPEYNPRTL